MAIEEIIKETNIDFKNALNLNLLEKLFYYIAKRLPANISYQVTHYNSFYNDKNGVALTRGSVKVAGSISSLKNPGAFDFFSIKSSEHFSFPVSGIEFQRVPGWDLSDYRPEIRELWRDVRELANKYIDSNYSE